MYWIDKVDERGCDGRLEVEEEEDVQVKEKKRGAEGEKVSEKASISTIEE